VKLLFISQFIARPDQPGQNRIFDFLQRLAGGGHEPHVVTCGVHYLEGTVSEELARKRIVDSSWGPVRVTTTYASPGFRSGIGARLRSYLTFAWYAFRAALRVKPVDAIMVSIQPMFVVPLAWLVAVIRRVPFILEVRDLWPDTAIAVGLIRSRILIRLGRALEMFAYRRASHIIVIGPEMKRRIVAKGIPEAKIDVIPQGFQPSTGAVRERDEVRAEMEIGTEFVVMYAGAFGAANNDLPLILDAAARLRDQPGLLFVLVGDGDKKPEYLRRCESERLDSVRFLPMVARREVPSLLRAADACIMTLPPGEFWKIFLQNKIFDYMGWSRPVIAAVEGDQADLLRESDGGIVVSPGDLDGLCRGIMRLKEDPDLARRLGENGRSYVRKHLMREALLDRYISLLERLVEPS
jgi:glycosyltransferase involved in cell wall biosynthesis